MKLVKKVAATLLGLTMAFSFGACDFLGIGGKTDSSDSNGWENSSPDGNDGATGEGAKYMEGLVNSIREANTLTVNVEFNYAYEEVDKTFGTSIYDEEYGDYVHDDWNDSEETYASGDITVVIAKVGEAYSLSLEGTVSYSDVYYDYDYETENYEEQIKITEEDTKTVKSSIIGDTAYIYNAEENQWYKTPIDWAQIEVGRPVGAPTAANTVMTALAELYATLMEGDLTEVYNVLGPIFEQTLMIDIQNQKYEFELSVAEDINAAINYLTNLDYNQTVLSYLNSVLTEVGAETTVEEMLRNVAPKGTMTVQELYTQLNAALVEETGKDINGIKNELIEKLDINQFKDYADEETFAQISQMYTMISELNVETELAPYMSLTLNDLITMMFASQEEGAEPVEVTLGMLVEEMISMLDSVTLENALGDMTDGEYFYALETLQNLDLNELSESVAIQFNGYKVSKVDYDCSIDFTYEDDTIRQVGDVSAKLSIVLSSETTTLTAPEGAIELPSDDTLSCDLCNAPNVFYSENGVCFCQDCYNKSFPKDGVCDWCNSKEIYHTCIYSEWCEKCFNDYNPDGCYYCSFPETV